MSALSRTSRFFNRVGHSLIGPPIPMMQNVYLLPADRVRMEPIQTDNHDWLHKQITVLGISMESLRRMGPLVCFGMCPLLFGGLLALASIHGVKVGFHKAENAFSSHSTTASGSTSGLTPEQALLKRACDNDRMNGNALSPACTNLPQE